MGEIDIVTILNNIKDKARSTKSINRTLWLIDEYIKRLTPPNPNQVRRNNETK